MNENAENDANKSKSSYRDRAREALNKLKNDIVTGELPLATDQIVPHVLRGRLGSAVMNLHIQKMTRAEAQEIVGDTYQTLKEIHDAVPDFREMIPELKEDFQKYYQENEDTEKLIGSLSDFIDDFKETPGE